MRDMIREEVLGIHALDELERVTKADVIDWIDSGAALCRIAKPATPPTHLVSYFVLIDGEHVLLVDHIKAMLWLPTGGHVEPGEHPRETVRREAFEELGIQADFVHDAPLFVTSTTTVGQTAGHVDVSLWYVLRGDRNATLTHDASEFRGVQWFHYTKLPYPRTDPQMQRFIHKLYRT